MIIDIQHFGSTAVNGLSAKPIIDIMIVVDDTMQLMHLTVRWNNIDIFQRRKWISGRRYFVKINSDNFDIHTHHVHIYQKENPHISEELMFRNYLRINKR